MPAYEKSRPGKIAGVRKIARRDTLLAWKELKVIDKFSFSFIVPLQHQAMKEREQRWLITSCEGYRVHRYFSTFDNLS
jgi:hypothetical protein